MKHLSYNLYLILSKEAQTFDFYSFILKNPEPGSYKVGPNTIGCVPDNLFGRLKYVVTKHEKRQMGRVQVLVITDTSIKTLPERFFVNSRYWINMTISDNKELEVFDSKIHNLGRLEEVLIEGNPKLHTLRPDLFSDNKNLFFVSITHIG